MSLLITALVFPIFAQEDVTQFLGIPVDGTKSEMILKLKAKGFKYSKREDEFTGLFNNSEAIVKVVTNSDNIVRRIIVHNAYAYDNISDLIVSYNNLCWQFYNKDNYLPCSLDSIIYPTYEHLSIPRQEDIPYEITVNNKRYDTAFYQLPAPMDSIPFDSRFKNMITLDNGKEVNLFHAIPLMTKYSHRLVWFTIREYIGHYYIAIFYDNEKNNHGGKDL